MDSNALGTLRSKFLGEVRELENKLKDRRDRIKAIDLVLDMLIEGSGSQERNKPIQVNTNRFRKMGMQEAILKCMGEPIRWWLPNDIKNVLLAGGLKTEAKDPHSAITATLQRLAKKGKIEIGKTEKGRNRFKIKEGEAATEKNPSGNELLVQ